MVDVLIALGGAHNVWTDFARAVSLCNQAGVGYEVGAVNEAGRDYKGRLFLWATLHPEKLEHQKPYWAAHRAKKGRNTDYWVAAHKERGRTRIDVVKNEVWSGSSGLYLCQIAALEFGFYRIVCCGIPMTEEGHYFDNDPWRPATRYQRGWREAIQDRQLNGKIRSMSGWTRQVLGAPDTQWLAGGA